MTETGNGRIDAQATRGTDSKKFIHLRHDSGLSFDLWIA
jgi:hypothetical protein